MGIKALPLVASAAYVNTMRATVDLCTFYGSLQCKDRTKLSMKRGLCITRITTGCFRILDGLPHGSAVVSTGVTYMSTKRTESDTKILLLRSGMLVRKLRPFAARDTLVDMRNCWRTRRLFFVGPNLDKFDYRRNGRMYVLGELGLIVLAIGGEFDDDGYACWTLMTPEWA